MNELFEECYKKLVTKEIKSKMARAEYYGRKITFKLPKGWEKVNPDKYRVKSYKRII